MIFGRINVILMTPNVRVYACVRGYNPCDAMDQHRLDNADI